MNSLSVFPLDLREFRFTCYQIGGPLSLSPPFTRLSGISQLITLPLLLLSLSYSILSVSRLLSRSRRPLTKSHMFRKEATHSEIAYTSLSYHSFMRMNMNLNPPIIWYNPSMPESAQTPLTSPSSVTPQAGLIFSATSSPKMVRTV